MNHGAQTLRAVSRGQAGSHVAWEGAAGSHVGFSSAELRRGSWRYPGRAAGVERGLRGETLLQSVGGTEHAAGSACRRRGRPHTQCGARACIGAWRAQGDGGSETGSARAPASGRQRGREGTGTSPLQREHTACPAHSASRTHRLRNLVAAPQTHADTQETSCRWSRRPR